VNADLILVHARQLLTASGTGPARGASQSQMSVISDGALAAHDGRLIYAGSSELLLSTVTPLHHARIYDLGNAFTVMPGFVDAHTHAAYAGDRRAELRRRLGGESYAQIAASGGGIVATVAATRRASQAEIVEETRTRLDEMLACGTTTCEIKSGYGLTVDDELKLLRAIHAIAGSHPVSIVPTFMGAHEVPPEYRSDRSRYVDLVVETMIPAVAGERLAEWCDVFCENGVFTPEESRRILLAGSAAGLKPRIHADELGSSGGSRVAAAVGAHSADHLVHAGPDDIDALATAGVTATLLPTAAFYLKLGRLAPARQLIEAGVPVAIATDVNPGGGLSPSMPFAMALACFGMDMTFEEAFAAATLNGAWSLGLADTVGTLDTGKLADLVVIEGDAVNLLRVGPSCIQAVIKRGAIVHGTLPQARDREGIER